MNAEKDDVTSQNAEQSGSAADVARAMLASGDAAGVARLAGSSALRMATSVVRSSLAAVTEIAEQINSGEPITDIVDERVDQVRQAAVSALGLDGAAAELARGNGRSLRAQGDALLDISWNTAAQPKSSHPSFQRILNELTPDEARILRFLAVAGPQPAIDIRTHRPFGIGSVRVAGGISLIAQTAGCSWPDRDHHYFANLNRLGLVRFSEEPVTDFRRYSVLSALPRASAAREKAGKVIEIYRSIHLSLFGLEFCETCFTLDGYDAGGWATYRPDDRYLGRGPRNVAKPDFQ